MGKLLDYIAKETQGECFASFKYCYDNMLPPNIEYEAKEDSYINMKEFAEKYLPSLPEEGVFFYHLTF